MRKVLIGFLISATAAACGEESTPADPDARLTTPDAMIEPPPMPDAMPGAPDARPPATNVDVTADITSDTTWTADHFYTLKDHIFVLGATLTIEPGVVIYGGDATSLVVTSTARLVAEGTADAPIVFTSVQTEGTRAPGDWGGVALLGLAPINVAGGSAAIEGFPAGTANTQYGGTDATHDCGSLAYVRIEFAGFQLAPNNELNGLTLAGCGSGTSLDHVQVHKGADDGLEIFGGAPNVRHVVLSQSQDDSLDWDFGFSGKMQFVLIQQSLESNHGIEADNNNSANDATPRSNPLIYNMSIIGSDAPTGMADQNQRGMHLRRGTAGRFHNVIVAHVADFPVDVDGASSVAQAMAGELSIENSIFFDNGNQATWQDASDNDGGFDEGMFFLAAANDNLTSNPMIESSLHQTSPSFVPAAGSPALDAANAATPPGDGWFDTTATFIGAVGQTDWTAGWTAFPQD